MKVKIEFEVNADFNKVMKVIYDRVDCLYYDLLDIDDNFKYIELNITTHRNEIAEGNPHINFHNSFYGLLKCPMYHNGTCWGTRNREKCTCEGFKSFCTHYPKGE